MLVYDRAFSIADTSISLRTEHPLRFADAFEKFQVLKAGDETGKYTADFKEVSRLHIPEGSCIYEESRFLIYRLEDGRYCRVFRENFGEKTIYAVSLYGLEQKKIQIEYLPEGRIHFEDVQKAFLHIAWEWILMNENKLMLHASCVETPFGGLAFSGPSGIGKSTQGDLWCRYGKGRLLNGDKTILYRKQGLWLGSGSPYAGSSQCYVNDSCQLRGLFFLRQGEKCSLRTLGVVESFKKIYSGLTVNHWDSKYVETVCNLAQQLAMDVPAYEFTCTPDKAAVDFLKQKLLQGGGNDGV